MATAIRMRRGGRTHAPYYRIVVLDSRTRDRGPEIDILGYHHPCARPEPVSELNAHKALEWLRKGAQPSDTAKSVLSKMGVIKHFHDGTTPEEEVVILKGEAVEAPAPKPAPVKEEAPAEEAAPVEDSAPEAPVEAPAEEETPEA